MSFRVVLVTLSFSTDSGQSIGDLPVVLPEEETKEFRVPQTCKIASFLNLLKLASVMGLEITDGALQNCQGDVDSTNHRFSGSSPRVFSNSRRSTVSSTIVIKRRVLSSCVERYFSRRKRKRIGR